jgi:D-aminopeptidase
MNYIFQLLLIFTGYITMTSPLYSAERPRARDIGIHIGIFQPGIHNAITDVDGVRVGHRTIIEGNDIRTGVTAIFPHRGNIFLEKVPAAIELGNAFGKLTGYPQVEELGELETPIILTNTLSTWIAASAIAEYILRLPGNEDVRSVNPVVAETNDGHLNDIRQMYITSEHVFDALESASGGPVREGAIGAGTGTTAFGWKGGIGTSSRVLPERYGGYTIGVLVQSNFGGMLIIDGVPVGRELGEHMLQDTTDRGDGSVIIIVATDAPLTASHLKRLAKRALIGLGRTGSVMSHGSGDFVIAFSTSAKVRLPNQVSREIEQTVLKQNELTPLFQAVVEATEEAIYNSIFKAETMTGSRGVTVEALPIDKIQQIMRKYRQEGNVR